MHIYICDVYTFLISVSTYVQYTLAPKTLEVSAPDPWSPVVQLQTSPLEQSTSPIFPQTKKKVEASRGCFEKKKKKTLCFLEGCFLEIKGSLAFKESKSIMPRDKTLSYPIFTCF